MSRASCLALAGAVAVLAKGPGGSELIKHNETGFLVDVRDPVETSLGVRKLIETPALRRRLAVSALSVVRSSAAYSWSHVTDILERHYKELQTLRQSHPKSRGKPPPQNFNYW